MKLVECVVAAACALATTEVHADSAEAEVLFRAGRAQIQRGEVAAGCDKLAASQRIEPSVGTLLNLGDCRERLGRLASAWVAFRAAESLAGADRDGRRRAEAVRRAVALESRLSYVVVEVPRPVDQLVVRRDGVAVDRGVWGIAVPIDPGHHEIVAAAPGFVTWRAAVEIDGRHRRRVVIVPPLSVAPIRLPLDDAPPPETSQVHAIPIGPALAPSRWTSRRIAAAGVVVVGAGALAVGAVSGVHALDLRDRADARCPDVTCADADALRLNDRAHDAALRANIALVAGGALVATAAILWLTGGPERAEPTTTVMVGDHGAGLAFARRW